MTLALAGVKLDNKDTWSKSDPFVRISKARENGAWVPVLKTEVRAGSAGLSLTAFGSRCPAALLPAVQLPHSRASVPLPSPAQVIDNNLNPTWKPFQASMAQLCNCDPHRPLLLEVRAPHAGLDSHGFCAAS